VKFNRVIFIVVVGLSSCADQPLGESQRNGKKLNCLSLSNPQRDECLQNIPPDYNKYEQERQKLLNDKSR
jgi:hypothetical protein